MDGRGSGGVPQRPRRGLYVNIREPSGVTLTREADQRPPVQGLARPMPRRGSDDHLRPMMPTPGDIRRMFGQASINSEPEYARSSDPVPWEAEQEEESMRREAMKAWLRKTLIRRRDPDEAAEILLAALGIPPGEEPPCTMEDVASVRHGLNKKQLEAVSVVKEASSRRPGPVVSLAQSLLREGRVAAYRVREVAEQLLDSKFSLETARRLTLKVSTDESEATLVLGKVMLCAYLEETQRGPSEMFVPSVKSSQPSVRSKVCSKRIPSYLKQTESFLQKVKKVEPENKVSRGDVKRLAGFSKKAKDDMFRRAENKPSFRSVSLKEDEDSLASINMDDVRTSMDYKSNYGSSYGREGQKMAENKQLKYTYWVLVALLGVCTLFFLAVVFRWWDVKAIDPQAPRGSYTLVRTAIDLLRIWTNQ